MCEPATIAMIGMSAISAGAGAMQQNAASDANRESAINSMNIEQQATTDQYIEQSRAAVEEGYELVLEGRSQEAQFLNMAAESGVQGISVNEGFFSVANANARTDARFAREAESRRLQTNLNMKGIRATAANRINSQPKTSILGATLTGAASGAGAAAGAGKFDKILKDTLSTGGAADPSKFYET
jgi:hypothetical protein